MTTQIWLDHTGGPEVLQARTVDPETPGPGQVWLEQEAVGVNYLDVTQRAGAVPIVLPGNGALDLYLQRWDVSNLFIQGMTASLQNANYYPTNTVGAMQISSVVYIDARSSCHTVARTGIAGLFPALAGGHAIQQKNAMSIIRVTLWSAHSVSTAGGTH